MKNNQSQNMHFLNFDPIFPKNQAINNYNNDLKEGKTSPLQFKPEKYMRMIHYGGNDELFEVESGAVYNEDGTVTVSYFAPNAKLVQIKYRLHNYKYSSPKYRKDRKFYSKDYTVEDMELGEDGYWRKTINPGVGYHSIFYIVDGQVQINKQGPYVFDDDGIRNIVDIPDDEDTQIHDVPHGSITREIYFSKETNRYRCCWIYTPASYANSNNGYVYKEGNNGMVSEGRLDNVIIGDCLPFIESKYRIIKDRNHRAVAGLSMGGGHARRLGLGHPDVFANVGMFSSGECFPTVTDDMDFTELFSDADKFNNYMDKVVVACGDADPRYDQTYEQVKEYQDKGFNIEFLAYQGQHEWNVWRYCAKDFVKNIFK